jgi:hypothetical protein
MTQEDILRMAREAGLAIAYAERDEDGWLELERFAALVAAAERNRTWTQKHWTEYERSIAAAERAACADICDQHASIEGIAQRCAAEIRARGKT